MHGQMKGVGAIGARRFTTPVDHRRGTTGAGIERTGSRFGVYRETWNGSGIRSRDTLVGEDR